MQKRGAYLHLVHNWREYFNQQISQGMAKWHAYREIAEMYDVSPYAVRYYLERDELSEKARERWKRKVKKLRRNRSRNKYDLWYHRLIRRPQDFLEPILSENEEIDLEYVASELRSLSDNTPFTEHAARTVIEKYNTLYEEGIIRGPPLKELEPGKYRVADDTS